MQKAHYIISCLVWMSPLLLWKTMLVLTELVSNFILTVKMILCWPTEENKDGVRRDQFSVGRLELDPFIFIRILQPCSWVCQMFPSPESFGFIEDCGLWERSMVWWGRVEGIQEWKCSLQQRISCVFNTLNLSSSGVLWS